MRSELTLFTQSCNVRQWVDTDSCQLKKTQFAADTFHHITHSGSLYFLFCYGTGTPNSPRRVPVSLELGLRHLLLLSDRRFAQSAIFSPAT